MAYRSVWVLPGGKPSKTDFFGDVAQIWVILKLRWGEKKRTEKKCVGMALEFSYIYMPVVRCFFSVLAHYIQMQSMFYHKKSQYFVLRYFSACFMALIWAPSSEIVSSSIPSWQISTAHAQTFSGARDLAFCLKVSLDSLLVWASSEGSGETARMRRLAWTFAARIGD